MYIESSSPRSHGDRARLLGGPFKPRQTVCLQFYYHMFGPDVGHLAVYKSFDKTHQKLLWSRTGQIDVHWHKALVTIHDENGFMVGLSF